MIDLASLPLVSKARGQSSHQSIVPIGGLQQQGSAVGTPHLADQIVLLQACEKFPGTTNTVLCYRQTFRSLFCCRKHCLVACRKVTITRLLASKLSWPLAAKSCSPSNSIPT